MGQPKYKTYPSEDSNKSKDESTNSSQDKHKILKLRREIEESLKNPEKLAKAIDILINWNNSSK